MPTHPRPSRKPISRPTIGLLIARIGRSWGKELMAGLSDAAQSLDVNLLVFAGGQLKPENSTDLSLYDLINPEMLDGLILFADLGHGVEQETILHFCERFAPRPMLAISMEMGDLPAILSDGLNGMRQAVEHLIEEHHRRRVAFIRGPVGQFEAEQRYQAYLETLQAHKIPFDPQLVVEGDFNLESGRAAVLTLLDERGAKFDAVAAANDRMAFGALDALQERGLQVPTDIALVGFDDVLEAQMLVVPLTTVRQPFYASGQQAISLMVSLLRGEAVPRQTMMPTELVTRWSCGCLPLALRQVAFDDLELLVEPTPLTEGLPPLEALAARRKPALEALQKVFTDRMISGASAHRRQISATLTSLWERFLSDLSGETHDRFPKVIAQVLLAARQLPIANKDTTFWHGFLSEFRCQVLPYLPNRQIMLRAENLLEQARILIGEVAQREQAYQRLEVEQQEALLQSLGHTLATLPSMREMASAITQHFPGLGIQHCHLGLFDPTDLSASPSLLRRDPQARLFLAYDLEEVCSTDIPPFPARLLAPGSCLPQARRYSAVITLLSFAQSPMGFLWTEVGPSEWEVYIRLSNLLSSAIYRALLVKEREQAMQEIGRLLVRAEQHAIELDIAKKAAETAAQRAQQALAETDGLFRAARAILGATEVAEICQKLTNHFTGLVQADRVLVFLVDHNQEKVLLSVHNGRIVDDLQTTYQELRSGISGKVFETGQPVLSTSADDGIEPPETADRRRRAGTGAIIVVPLKTKGQVIGTATAINRTDQRQFEQHDVDLLMSLATQAATAIEGAHMYQAEQERRQVAEILVQAGRKLSSSLKLHEVPGYVLEQLHLVVPYERSSLFLQEEDKLRIVAQRGFPEDARSQDLQISIREGDVYQQVVAAGRPIIIDDVTRTPGWKQVEWLPLDHSWMGVPLFSKDHVIGMLSLTRKEVRGFSQDDDVMASTFALQAAIALENAGLYNEITRFNEQLEQMVAQRTEELKVAYLALEKLDKNKTVFINVAAHELRTPLTVMKGYMGMFSNDPIVKTNEYLAEAVKGVLKGVDRLHTIVNSMLDVARIDSQVLDMRPEIMSVPVTIKRIQADLQSALQERNLTLELENVDGLPLIHADPPLVLKVLQNVIGNAIKYTPDGGRIVVSGRVVQDDAVGACVEILIKDSGIGIDPEQQELIFEKFYQTGAVEVHSSGETKFKGGGPGLGLAIARGIIQAHRGRIWVESPCHDEENCPGSTFHILLPIASDLPYR